jgi:signal transduction histidine kinase
MTVKDFGIGFDPEVRAHHDLGLTSMKERLKAVSGRPSIWSQPNGTTIRAFAPIAQAEPTSQHKLANAAALRCRHKIGSPTTAMGATARSR